MSQQQQTIKGRIETWLARQPKWFSPALHISALDQLTEENIRAVACRACQENGLSLSFDGGDAIALEDYSAQDILLLDSSSRAVFLESVTIQKGINALADNSELDFAEEGLTVIYGENGSGKSGFSRLIRNTCTSRAGAVEVLPNVFQRETESAAVFKVKADGTSIEHQWTSSEKDFPYFPEILFFDSACADQEIESKNNEVLYVPPIIGVFNRLSQLVGHVSNFLKTYSDNLTFSITQSKMPDYAQQYSAVPELLNCVSSEKAQEIFKKIELSLDERKRYKLLPGLIEGDPCIELSKVKRKLSQLNSLRDKLVNLYGCCNDKFYSAYTKALREWENAQSAVEAAQEILTASSSLEGIGSEAWRALWQAAKMYSENFAYKSEPFPFVGHGAKCPLCQQDLSNEAKKRLGVFEEFMTGVVELNKKEKQKVLQQLVSTFLSGVTAILGEKGSIAIIEKGEIQQEMDELIKKLEQIDSVPDEITLKELCVFVRDAGASVRKELDALNEKVSLLTERLDAKALENMKLEYTELAARDWLYANRDSFMRDVETRYTKNAIYETRKQCTTRWITSLVTEISQTEVVERMEQGFLEELQCLGAERIPVTFGVKTRTGREIQEISLASASMKARTSAVLSEGERRIIALAGFFAQVDAAKIPSTIVLDDPVTSLDHKWRNAVSKRIVEKAAAGPVVVFTHDPVFCSCISRISAQMNGNLEFRTIRKRGNRSGVITKSLDWDACNVKGRISLLREKVEDMKKKQRRDDYLDNSAFKEDIQASYSRLRAVWERAVEEVLLAEVVVRMSPPVHTMKLRYLPDIGQEDINIVDEAMTKCSFVTEAHDAPQIPPPAFPTIEELEADIRVLDEWCKQIRRRRN